METTVFDKIIRREIPATVVYEDDVALAFRDVAPQAPVHVLVIPKKRLSHFSELQSAEPVDVGQFFSTVAKVASKLGLDQNGYRIVVNHGRDGQQTVEYLHAHIIAGRLLTWPPG